MNLVQMTCEVPPHPGGPTTADVPESEVQLWESQGWRVVSPGSKQEPGEDAMGYGKPKPKPRPKDE